MEVTTTQYKRCDLVQVTGRVDSSTAPQLETALAAITDDGRFKIVLDLSKVSFVSSRGWWVLIGAQKNCKRFNRGEVALVGVQKDIRDSLELVGMGDYFKSFDDVTSAVGNF